MHGMCPQQSMDPMELTCIRVLELMHATLEHPAQICLLSGMVVICMIPYLPPTIGGTTAALLQAELLRISAKRLQAAAMIVRRGTSAACEPSSAVAACLTPLLHRCKLLLSPLQRAAPNAAAGAEGLADAHVAGAPVDGTAAGGSMPPGGAATGASSVPCSPLLSMAVVRAC